jgi:hypothetical protein
MPVLQAIKRLFSARTGVRKASDVPKQAAGDIRDGAQNVAEGAARNVGRGAASPLAAGVGLGGLSLGGAYAYGQYSDQQAAASATERQQSYYDRVREIERLYQNGDISEAEMERMKAEARQAYYASQNSTRGLGPLDVIARMGTIELVVALVAAAVVGKAVLPVVARRVDLPDFNVDAFT